MAAGETWQGRRVKGLEALEFPGDYALHPVGSGTKPSLWFRLPRTAPCPAGENEFVQRWWDRFWLGDHRIDASWDITEEAADGTITVSPSIRIWTQSGDGGRIKIEWHGHLEHGVWREV